MSHSQVGNVVVFDGLKYPAQHWLELRRFMEGDELDPKKTFRLVDDTWDAWRYVESGRPKDKQRYRFKFGHLRSWLKPYVKRFCYNVIIGSGNNLTRTHTQLPYLLTVADRHIIEHGYEWLDDLASPVTFEPLWGALLVGVANDAPVGLLPQAAVISQQKSRTFWVDLSLHYGVPQTVPSVAPYKQRTPAEIGADKSRLIPDAVIRQLANKLACHRDGIVLLNNYHHLRLCVLLLVISLGRRIEEVLSSPRGQGPDGPLERHPCRHEEGEPGDALWFRFSPNKGGNSEWVYISREWEGVATYCVRHLIAYGDQVRQFAAPEEKDLLILVSTWNWTAGNFAGKAIIPSENQDFSLRGSLGGPATLRGPRVKKRTSGLTYKAFTSWLNGYTYSDSRKSNTGVMQKWGITSDGSASGPIHHFRTHDARHTRQSALAVHPEIPLLIRQRDLNHGDKNMQFAYQHVLDEQNKALMTKIKGLPLLGQEADWLNHILGLGGHGGQEDVSPGDNQPVRILTPRWRKLIESHSSYVVPNVVDLGICDAAEGPDGCVEYNGRGGAGTLLSVIGQRPPNEAADERDSKVVEQAQSTAEETTAELTERQTTAGDPGVTSSEIITRLGERLKGLR